MAVFRRPLRRIGLHPDWSRVHGPQSGEGWGLLLAPMEGLYGLGVRLRRWAYKRGIREARSLPGPVISIGNLTAGGTGKTPAVRMLAQWAKGEGYRAAVLSRGYGRSSREKVLAVSDGARMLADSRQAGDEPFFLASKLPGIPVVVSRRRHLAGMYANERMGSDFFILDDGFQHVALRRDLDIVLIDGAFGFGNGHLLPRGPLREPLDGLSRADAVIVSRFREDDTGRELLRKLERDFPLMPVFLADHVPKEVMFPNLNRMVGPEFLKGRRVAAFAGIARPEAFQKTLAELGVDVVHFVRFSDHHPFGRNEVGALVRKGLGLGAEFILTTEKDWARLGPVRGTLADVGFLVIEFRILAGGDRFFDMIRKKAAQRCRV